MSFLFVSGVASLVDYAYDTANELWCELTLAFNISRKQVDMSNVLRKAAAKAVIRQVPDIKRAFIIQNNKSEPCITTDGANIQAMFKYDRILDLKKLACNNIHDMAR